MNIILIDLNSKIWRAVIMTAYNVIYMVTAWFTWCFQVQPEEHVIDQGDDGDNFYVIDRWDMHYDIVYQLLN